MQIESNRKLSPTEHDAIAQHLDNMAITTERDGGIFMDDKKLTSTATEVLVGELHRLAAHHRAEA